MRGGKYTVFGIRYSVFGVRYLVFGLDLTMGFHQPEHFTTIEKGIVHAGVSPASRNQVRQHG